MKKITIAIAILVIISGAYLLLKKDPKPVPTIKQDRHLPSHPVRSLKLWQDLNKRNPEVRGEAFEESNHGGVAAFVGPFRLEVALSKRRVIGVYVDNQKNMATMPKGVDIKIEFPATKEKTQLKVYDNGLLIGMKKKEIKFPLKFVLSGTLGKKPFKYEGELQKLRENPIIKRGKRND